MGSDRRHRRGRRHRHRRGRGHERWRRRRVPPTPSRPTASSPAPTPDTTPATSAIDTRHVGRHRRPTPPAPRASRPARSPTRSRSSRPRSRASPTRSTGVTAATPPPGRSPCPTSSPNRAWRRSTGDNGGATDHGVTADEITIVYYEGQEADPIIAYITDAIAVDDTNAEAVRDDGAHHRLLRDVLRAVRAHGQPGHLRRHRRRRRRRRRPGRCRAHRRAVLSRSSCSAARRSHRRSPTSWPPTRSCASAARPRRPTQFYIDRDPYVWALDGSAAQKQTHAVEFITKQLIGKNAEHGGDAVVDQPRTFGLLYLETSAESKQLADDYAAAMAAAGAPFAEVVAYALDPATIQATASQAISKLKAAGVTTVVFSGDPVAPRDFTKEATAQEYFPEWFISASGLVDTNAFARTYDQAAVGARVRCHAGRRAHEPRDASATTPSTTGSTASRRRRPTASASSSPTRRCSSPSPRPSARTSPTRRGRKRCSPPAARRRPSASRSCRGAKGCGPSPTTSASTTPPRSGGTPSRWVPTRSARRARACTCSSTAARGTCPASGPTDDKLFVPDGAVAIYDTPPPGEEPPSFPSPAGS